MKRGRGKAKGSALERAMCALLSLWVTDGANKDSFWRSAMSGGRATVHVRKGAINRQAGDICAVAPEGHILTDHFFVECKHYRDLAITSFFLKRVGKLEKFWSICYKQALQHNRVPMLIARQNNAPDIVVTPAFITTLDGSWVHRMRSVRVTRLDLLLKRPFAAFMAANPEVFKHAHAVDRRPAPERQRARPSPPRLRRKRLTEAVAQTQGGSVTSIGRRHR